MSKKSTSIALVLVSGLMAACGSDEGKYIQKDDTVRNPSGSMYITRTFYWVPRSGTPVQVSPEEFNANHASVVRGGFGESAHTSEGAHSSAGE